MNALRCCSSSTQRCLVFARTARSCASATPRPLSQGPRPSAFTTVAVRRSHAQVNPPPLLDDSPRVPPSMTCWGVERGVKDVGALQLLEVATPTISHPREVLVRVRAASLNPIDVAVLGGYGSQVLSTMRAVDGLLGGDLSCRGGDEATPRQPLVVGRDFSGVVVSRGRGVDGVEVGQAVMGVVSPHRMGAHAQYVLTHQDNVVPCPLPPVQAASLPYAGLTAHSAVAITAASGRGGARVAGQRVLVTGAGGGVGLILVQLLRAWGADVAGVCAGSSFEQLSSLGVHELYDYTDSEAMDMLALEHSFDLVLDGSGCRDLRYMAALKQHASATYVTLSSPLLTNTDQLGLLMGCAKSALDLVQQNVSGFNRGRTVKWGYFTPSAAALRELGDMVQQGKLVPVIDKVFPYSEAEAAYQHMQSGSHRGKTVLDFSL